MAVALARARSLPIAPLDSKNKWTACVGSLDSLEESRISCGFAMHAPVANILVAQTARPRCSNAMSECLLFPNGNYSAKQKPGERWGHHDRVVGKPNPGRPRLQTLNLFRRNGKGGNGGTGGTNLDALEIAAGVPQRDPGVEHLVAVQLVEGGEVELVQPCVVCVCAYFWVCAWLCVCSFVGVGACGWVGQVSNISWPSSL